MGITFSAIDIAVADALREFNATAEADIRMAYGEMVDRPVLSGIPEHVYVALMHSLDEDLKAHDAEVEACIRRLQGP